MTQIIGAGVTGIAVGACFLAARRAGFFAAFLAAGFLALAFLAAGFFAAVFFAAGFFAAFLAVFLAAGLRVAFFAAFFAAGFLADFLAADLRTAFFAVFLAPFFAAGLRAVVFFAVFLAAFLAVAFLAVFFTAFLAPAFFTAFLAVFLAAGFFTADLRTVFLAAAFLATFLAAGLRATFFTAFFAAGFFFAAFLVAIGWLLVSGLSGFTAQYQAMPQETSRDQPPVQIAPERIQRNPVQGAVRPSTGTRFLAPSILDKQKPDSSGTSRVACIGLDATARSVSPKTEDPRPPYRPSGRRFGLHFSLSYCFFSFASAAMRLLGET